MSDQDDIMPITLPSDEELFKSEEPTEPEAQAEEAQEAEAEQTTEPEPEKEASEAEPHRVPLTELLNEREKRQGLEQQMQQMQAYMQQMQQYEQAQAQQQQTEWPDMFESPEFYQERLRYAVEQMPQYVQEQVDQRVNQQLAAARTEFLGEMSLKQARSTDPETYDKAWEELSRRVNGGDHSWRLQVLQSQDPGQEVLNLYKQNTVAQDVGNDPEAYFQKRLDAIKQDPAALAALLSGGQQPASQSPLIDLPPSINKAGGGGGGFPTISNRDLWSEINK